MRFIFPLVFAMTLILSSCSSVEEYESETMPLPQIVFLFSPGGLGDMSYNDCILEGVQRFKKENVDVDIYRYSPGTLREAEKIFTDWLKRPQSDIPVLFVLGSSDYEPMAELYLAEYDLAENKSILLFESRKRFKDAKIHTFQISMFGASFLAGVCAGVYSETTPLVMLANSTDGAINCAKDGFVIGYGNKCDVEYLAEDWTGYVSASLAYRRMSEWKQNYDFIFPVAGGSNAGVYRYSREFNDSPLLAGMDVDQSSLSNRITGSVIKRIDKLIYTYLTEWVAKGTMPKSQLYGLESGYADWLIAPQYENDLKNLVDRMRPDAINSEKAYYATSPD